LDAYRVEVLPKIHEVFSVQEKVSLPNSSGDHITGYIDFVASFVDDPSTVYIIDNKTSSTAYKPDSVQNSEQLSTYCEFKETNKAAYIVVEKKFRKREPRIRINIIKDTIPEAMFDKTFKGFDDVLSGIKANKFEKNEDSCYAYGCKCQYFDICKGREGKGLIKID
jgi:hypothetical protein